MITHSFQKYVADFLIYKYVVVFDRQILVFIKYVSVCDKVSCPQFFRWKTTKNFSAYFWGNMVHVYLWESNPIYIMTATCSLGILEHTVCDVMVVSFI
jgi:hypothetical protein